jgi:hypothetical protein
MHANMGLAATVSLAVLAALVVPAFAPAAQASAAPASASAPQWAYGAQRWSNTTVNYSGGSFSAEAYFAWHVVISETNTSATTREIEAVRTVGMTYFVQYCRPNCPSANATGNLSVRAFQQLTAFVNLTTNATVYAHVNGSGVATSALGVLNASDLGRAGLDESYAITRGGSTGAHGSLAVSRGSAMSVAFSPALGLLPWNATQGEGWNASSDYTASGGWNDAYRYSDSLGGAGRNASGSSSGQVSRNGTEQLFGRDLGNLTLHNGANVTVVLLGFGGPFAFGDGLFLTTGDADLFGGGSAPWAGHAFALGVSALTAVDVRLDRGDHGAEIDADAGSANMASTPLGASNVQVGAGAPPGPASPPGSAASMQAQPESPPAAEAASACLVNTCGGPAPNGGAASYLGIVLVAAAVSAVIVGVGLYAWRRTRPPTSPLAGPVQKP